MKFIFLAFQLSNIANNLSQIGKGILAADESIKTIGNRFESINLENTIQNRNEYRRMLFRTPHLEKYISGVILYEETLKNPELTQYLRERDIILGIKVDKGTVLISENNNELLTKGMDDLYERAEKYYKQGARFAKWRSVFHISDSTPSEEIIKKNSWDLGRYAKIVQEAGLVPIIEPEILMDGDHSIEKTAETQKIILQEVYKSLLENEVLLEGTLLKPSFTLPGVSYKYKNNINAKTIAEKTLEVFQSTIPRKVPGILFLSGGLSESDATLYLNEINKIYHKNSNISNISNISNKSNKSWNLSFSYGRALQNSCLKTWNGKKENIKKAQKELLSRARDNSLASLGKLKETSDRPEIY